MKVATVLAAVVFVCILVASCMPGQNVTITTTVTQSNEDLLQQLNKLQADYEVLLNQNKSELANTQTTDTGAEKDLATLQAEYDSLKEAYNNLTKNNAQTGLRNPSWAELKEFVKNDNIDGVTYNLNTFACSGYAIILRDRARKLGYRCAFVQVAFPGTAGHALTAFQTTDMGLIYIDCTEADKVAYVKEGQSYGTIQLDAVLERYIDCSGSPGDFWQALKYAETGNTFSYDYYIGYQKRWNFYDQTIDAYNQAADQFNKGAGQLTHAQMITWQDNITALENELGNTIYESPGITGNIEIYWGDNP